MKPFGHKNYGSIPHLSNSKLGEKDYYINEGMENILTVKKRNKFDTIYVFEKYDGSNIGIGKLNNEIIPLTRAGYVANTSEFEQHKVFYEFVKENEKFYDTILNNGERICGEWLYQIHGLQYEIKGFPIVFFDLFENKNKRLPFEELKNRVPKDLIARLIHSGEPATVESLLPELNKKTERIKSIENPEGLIYRVEKKGKVDFLAKWVRGDFPTGLYMKDEIFNIEKNKFLQG